jgi:hypothetical protein
MPPSPALRCRSAAPSVLMVLAAALTLVSLFIAPPVRAAGVIY